MLFPLFCFFVSNGEMNTIHRWFLKHFCSPTLTCTSIWICKCLKSYWKKKKACIFVTALSLGGNKDIENWAWVNVCHLNNRQRAYTFSSIYIFTAAINTSDKLVDKCNMLMTDDYWCQDCLLPQGLHLLAGDGKHTDWQYGITHNHQIGYNKYITHHFLAFSACQTYTILWHFYYWGKWKHNTETIIMVICVKSCCWFLVVFTGK